MHHIRPLLFWSFITTFFILSSLVVFYAFGYRFNFERGIFIYTGSISIKSNPENVSIKVDGKMIPEQNLSILNDSILIAGLTPGEHFIEVSAPDYSVWSKKALVQSGLSTEFWNVLLAQDPPPLTTIASTDPILKIFPAPDENLFAVAKNNNAGDLIIDTLDTSTNVQTGVFALPQVALAQNDENIEWSPNNTKLIIPLEHTPEGTERSYSIVNVENKKLATLQVPTLQEHSLSNPRWDSTTRNFIFYLRGTTLYRANTEALLEPPVLVKENIRAYDISGSSIYYLNQDNGIIYRVPADRTDTTPTQITTAAINTADHGTYSIVVYDESRIAIREKTQGKLFIYNKSSPSEIKLKPLAERGIRGVQFSNDGKKLLFFSDNEINVYFTLPWEAQPLREADTILQVARFSNPIKNIQWTKDYEHVLFTGNQSAKIVELDNRDRRNITQIATFASPITQTLSRFENNQVYFTLEDGSAHWIEFPNPQNNIFGF